MWVRLNEARIWGFVFLTNKNPSCLQTQNKGRLISQPAFDVQRPGILIADNQLLGNFNRYKAQITLAVYHQQECGFTSEFL